MAARALRTLWLAASATSWLLAIGPGCSGDETNSDPREPMSRADLPVDIGVPDDAQGVDFRAFERGSEVPVASTFQGLEFARLAIRLPAAKLVASEHGAPRKVIVTVTFRSALDSSKEPAVNSVASAGLTPDCRADDYCYVTPILVEVSRLAAPESVEGLEVLIDVNVTAVDDSFAGSLETGGILAPDPV